MSNNAVNPSPARGLGDNRFDVHTVRADFPILKQTIHGKPLVYLDNGASSQKPRAVLDALTHYYENNNANVHRGVHTLSERATDAYEGARDRTARYLNANDSSEVVFTRGTTESINLVAHAWGRSRLGSGDEVLVSVMEHHSNIIPWQLLCEQTGATLKVIPISPQGELDMEAFHDLLGPQTKLVAVTQLSNALGTLNPIEQITSAAHSVGALVLVDGAQAVQHFAIDVQALECDFYAFSGHKIYGPTGIGALWARRELLDLMDPYQGGGEMIRTVSFSGSTWNDVPHKFEAGTPNIGGAVGLAAAMDYVSSLDRTAIEAHENDTLEYATEQMSQVPGLKIIGTAPRKAAIVLFVIDDIHAHDIGTIVDSQGVAIRVGHHCTMPLHEHLGLNATGRVSLALYNTREDIDVLIEALHKTCEMFAQ
jgi:cysteine desulfurase/selenocysteine lyase